MSARALTWAWQQHPATATQKLVLAAMADRADEDGICYPKTQWIADKCAPMPVRTVRWAISKLVEQGLVEKIERTRRADGTLSSWVYRLPVSSGNPLSLAVPNQLQPVVTQEPSKDLVSTDVLTQTEDSAQKAAFEELWDTLEVHVQTAPSAKSARAAYAKLVREMFEAGWTPEDVRRRAKRYHKRFPSMGLTVAALAKWGEELDRGKRTLTEGVPETDRTASGGQARGLGAPSVSVLPPEENARRMRELTRALIEGDRERFVELGEEIVALDGADGYLEGLSAPSSATLTEDGEVGVVAENEPVAGRAQKVTGRHSRTHSLDSPSSVSASVSPHEPPSGALTGEPVHPSAGSPTQ